MSKQFDREAQAHCAIDRTKSESAAHHFQAMMCVNAEIDSLAMNHTNQDSLAACDVLGAPKMSCAPAWRVL